MRNAWILRQAQDAVSGAPISAGWRLTSAGSVQGCGRRGACSGGPSPYRIVRCDRSSSATEYYVMFEANGIAHTFDKLSASLVEEFFWHLCLTFSMGIL